MTEMMKRTITSTVLGMFTWIALIYLPPIVFTLFLACVLIEILVFEWPKFFPTQSLAFWLITPFYPLLPFALMFALNTDAHPYQRLLFMMFVLVSSVDSGSFMVGVKYGKHKIAPDISPAKTWEGFLGGCITAILTMALVVWWHGKNHGSWITLTAVTLTVSVIALCGDLFESWLKRRARIKDAGTILPGHGGFLDRFDGVLFAVFFFYLFKDELCALFGG